VAKCKVLSRNLPGQIKGNYEYRNECSRISGRSLNPVFPELHLRLVTAGLLNECVGMCVCVYVCTA
jgi:hypothetical protein